MKQIALNTELVRPAAHVMTSDAALEYEMKLLNQAIEESLHDEVNVVYICHHSFNGHFPDGPGLAGTRLSPSWIFWS